MFLLPKETVLLTNMTPGLSETLEVQEKYAHLQEEQLDNLKDDLVSCIHGEEGQGGDDDGVLLHSQLISHFS